MRPPLSCPCRLFHAAGSRMSRPRMAKGASEKGRARAPGDTPSPQPDPYAAIRRSRLRTRYALALAVLAFMPLIRAAETPLAGWTTLTRPDRLAEFRTPLEVASVSSYDRTGGNDDGFSGAHSFVRKEDDGLVLADLTGPGVIYRIWTPTPTDDWMEFFFDGETEPRIRIRFRDLFLGKTAPFVKPLVGYGIGGFFSYVPLPYAKSCKVVIRAERIQFHQINYARYAPEAGIRTFTQQPTEELQTVMDRAQAVLGRKGQDISRITAPPGTHVNSHRTRVTLRAGGTSTLFESTTGGRIVGLRLSPPEALADKARNLTLRMSFDDGPPTVLCPAGDFFGFAWGEPAMRSLLIGSTSREAYCYFPMPYDHSARLELMAAEALKDSLTLDAEVLTAEVPKSVHEGRFGTVWRRENPTTLGRPFTFLDTQGRGHVVGTVLQAQGMESGTTPFFEGDDQTWIDGTLAVHGTGSEDFFNGGWYDVPDRWEKRLSLPLSGCLGYQKHLGRTGGYRLLLGDAYSYREGIRHTIEHAPTDNAVPTDYVGVTYFYAERPAAEPLPSAAERSVVDLTEIVFPAWWQIPIRAFPFQETTLTRKSLKIDDQDVRFLSVRSGAPDWVGPPYLYLTCNVPVAGQYAVAVEVVRGPEQARVQLFQDEIPAGDPVDLYAVSSEKSERLALGVLNLEAGDNPVMLKLVGQHQAATGLGLDLIQLICRRVE